MEDYIQKIIDRFGPKDARVSRTPGYLKIARDAKVIINGDEYQKLIEGYQTIQIKIGKQQERTRSIYGCGLGGG